MLNQDYDFLTKHVPKNIDSFRYFNIDNVYNLSNLMHIYEIANTFRSAFRLIIVVAKEIIITPLLGIVHVAFGKGYNMGKQAKGETEVLFVSDANYSYMKNIIDSSIGLSEKNNDILVLSINASTNTTIRNIYNEIINNYDIKIHVDREFDKGSVEVFPVFNTISLAILSVIGIDIELVLRGASNIQAIMTMSKFHNISDCIHLLDLRFINYLDTDPDRILNQRFANYWEIEGTNYTHDLKNEWLIFHNVDETFEELSRYYEMVSKFMNKRKLRNISFLPNDYDMIKGDYAGCIPNPKFVHIGFDLSLEYENNFYNHPISRSMRNNIIPFTKDLVGIGEYLYFIMIK